MASSKVVKVEDVNGPRQDSRVIAANDRSRTNQTVSSELLAYGTESSLLPFSRQDDDLALSEIEEESKDKIYPLPENWPKVPQLFRRRSCELTTTTTPCVNKAVSHLELLQNVIEGWFLEKEERKSTRIDTAVSVKKEIRFSETRDGSSKVLRSATTRSGSSQSTAPLSIQGFGIKEDEKDVEEPGPYLGAEDAINEVLTLLARLENDRQEAEAALAREKDRVVKLAMKIDQLSHRRMRELPAVVQKEHEECIVDLNELQWHVSYSSRNESRIKDRVEIAEVLNRRLKEDIEFVKKHIPLVEEKLELELEAMEKIRNAQTDTNQELDSTKSRQQKTEAKSNEATDKADKERNHIKRELDTVREALTNVNEELSEAKMTYNAYIHQINDIEQQLKDNEQELKVLEVKNENAKVAEEMQAAKVREVNTKIVESEFEHDRLQAENDQLMVELERKKKQYHNTITELELAIKGRDSRLRQVVLKNQEVEMEVQDYMDKISKCQRQKVSDEKNVARIHKEMQKIQQQLSVTMEEYNRVAGLNAAIREQLLNEQEKTFKMEESLKITAETLKKQVKDEVHTRTVMSSRITSDTSDLQKSRVDMREKKNKAAKVADDVITAVKNVREKVEKLRSAKQDKARRKANLTSQKQETIKQKEESEKRFEERINQIKPHHSHLKGDLLAVNKRLDHIEWKSDIMRNKMADMDKSQGMMDRLTTNTSKALGTLGDEIKELDLQIQAAEKVESDLKSQFNDVLDRIKNGESNHRKFLEERQRVKRQLEEEKTKSIDLNKEYASKYRSLQNNYMELKDKLMNNFEDRVKLENAIKDSRQLQALQIRMHGFMVEYYKYLGLFNTSELSRMEEQSINNSHKVTELQDSMDEALTSITEFLQTQMTGETVKKMAWEAVKKQEARAAKKDRLSATQTSSSIQVA